MNAKTSVGICHILFPFCSRQREIQTPVDRGSARRGAIRGLYSRWHNLLHAGHFHFMSCPAKIDSAPAAPPALCQHPIVSSCDKEKTSSTLCFCPRSLLKTKTSLTEISLLSRTNKYYPRCHLDSQHDLCAQRDTNISPANDVCLQRRRILWNPFHLTAPSAVHLTTCILPAFQRRRLSVKS